MGSPEPRHDLQRPAWELGKAPPAGAGFAPGLGRQDAVDGEMLTGIRRPVRSHPIVAFGFGGALVDVSIG